MITIAIAIIASLGAVVYNNSRITDMGKRIDDLNGSLTRQIDDKFALLSLQMKHMEENIMRILGEHETRIQKLEHKSDG